jgi:hypothetical protein
MSGGIAQLVAIGAQDAHIVGNPEVSFFRSNYKRHTNFAQTVERQVIQGNPSSNGMSTVRFERKGDMLGHVYLAANDGTKTVNYSPAEWLTKIAKVELLIGGQVIDDQTSVFSQFIAPAILAQNMSKSKSSLTETTKSRFYPLRFAFCENWQSALPLIALQYHDVELRITWGASLSTEKWECYSHFVYLDSAERETLAGSPQNMLITQTQRAIASNSRIQEINFNHPMKLLATADGSNLTIAGDTNKLKLQINGTDVTDFKYVDPHFTAVPAYYHTAFSAPLSIVTSTTVADTLALADNDVGTINAGVNAIGYTTTTVISTDGANKKLFLYPFCLETAKLQPTGSLNFSRIDSARLVCDTANHEDDIYGVNYNILRIENGMGGLMYSN